MQNRIRLALFAGSPVYFQAPLYRRLAADPRIEFTAIFASDQGARRPLVNGYHAPVDWGVDSLEGYRSIFLRNAHRNPTSGSALALRDFDVVKFIRNERFDALWLHGYHTVTHVLAAISQRTVGGLVLYREDQTLLSPRPYWKTAAKRVALRGLFRGSYGLFVGTENRRWFERWGIPHERLFHVPYAVDNESWQSASSALTPQRSELRTQLGITSNAPVILTVGRLVEKKQPLRLLRAFARVRSELPCSLLVVGSGSLEHEMRRIVASEGIPDVVFAGFLDQTQVSRAYASGDIFALASSHDETWGLVVNEAMNFALPIVVSDQVGCAADLVRSGENGFVVAHGDLDGLVIALRDLVASAELRAKFGAASRRKISSRTYDATFGGMLAALRAAVGESRWEAAERLPTKSGAA